VRRLHRGKEPPKVRRMIERQTGGIPPREPTMQTELAEPLTDPIRGS
jgi:hypothetical protein